MGDNAYEMRTYTTDEVIGIVEEIEELKKILKVFEFIHPISCHYMSSSIDNGPRIKVEYWIDEFRLPQNGYTILKDLGLLL